MITANVARAVACVVIACMGAAGSAGTRWSRVIRTVGISVN